MITIFSKLVFDGNTQKLSFKIEGFYCFIAAIINIIAKIFFIIHIGKAQ